MALNDYPGSNLPPGCTDRDIERAQGEGDDPREVECHVCHSLVDMAETCPICGALLEEPSDGNDRT